MALLAPFPVQWSIVGEVAVFDGRLDAIGEAGARLEADVVAAPGDELRIDIRQDDGSEVAIGLVRVESADPITGMEVAFVALGIDLELLSMLAGATRRAKDSVVPKMPPLPGAGDPGDAGRLRDRWRHAAPRSRAKRVHGKAKGDQASRRSPFQRVSPRCGQAVGGVRW